jgi:ATP-binding cassette subfamily F protein uup
MEGDGHATIYAGGWSDYQAQRSADTKAGSKPKQKTRAKPAKAPAPKGRGTLSFTETHRLEALPSEIERLETEIAKLSELLSDPELFTREPVKFEKATAALIARQDALEKAEEEWLFLADKAG